MVSKKWISHARRNNGRTLKNKKEKIKKKKIKAAHFIIYQSTFLLKLFAEYGLRFHCPRILAVLVKYDFRLYLSLCLV